MKKIPLFMGIIGAALVNSLHAQTYDLGIDFQDGVIPSVGINGVWSYGFDQIDTTGNVTNAVNFTPYTLHGGAPAGSDAYYTNGPLSIYQSPNFGGYGVITHDSDVPNARAVIRWTAPNDGTIYVDGSTWKFKFDVGNGREQDFYVRINSGPFLVAGTTSDSTLSDGQGIVLPQNEIHWGVNAIVHAGDNLDIIYWRHPGFVQDFSGHTETVNYVPTGSPLVTNQPVSREVVSGGGATFTVGATGATPLSYQWMKDGNPIAGATSNSLSISSAGVNDQGIYWAVVSNAVNMRASYQVVLDVIPPATSTHTAATEFSLASNPTARGWQYSESVGNGEGVVGPLTNEWNAPDFGPGQPGWQGGIPGVHAGYARRVNNGTDNGFDAPAGTLMTHGPTSVSWSAPAGDTNSYAYLSGGVWNLRHLGRSGVWNIYKNTKLLTTGNIDDTIGTSSSPVSFASGANGPDALLQSYSPGDTFRLELLEGDFQGINFTVATTNVAPDPFIQSQPLPQSVPLGGTATFSVTATGSNPLTYRWNFNGTNISGATNATLSITNVQQSDIGNYQVAVTSPGGVRHSVIVALAASQQPVGTPWDIVGDWQDGILPPVNIGPEGAWSYGYSPIADPNNYFVPFTFTPYPVSDGSHGFVGNPAYSINPGDPGSSTAQPFNDVISHTSSGPNFQPILFRWTAKRPITVNANGSAWTIDGNNRTQDFFVRKNSNAQFFASGTVVDGDAGNPIVWSTNGISLNPGDFIDLIVRRTPGQVQSFINVTEQIVEAPTGTPHISVHPSPASQTVGGGSTVNYSVTASGTGLQYQWYTNGVAIPGATASTLALSNVTTNNSGVYTVIVSNGTGSTTSDSAVLNVDVIPPTILSAARSFLNFNQVSAVYSKALQAGTATNIANYSVNNGNSVTAATINGGLTTVTLTLAKGIGNDQAQILTVNGIRDTVGNLIAANTQVTIVVPGDFVRLQDSSTNHLLVLEAEDFNRNLSPSGGNSWVFTNAPWLLQPTDANTNYSGTGVMLADPNLGNNRGSTPSGPELDYKVYFATAGTNYVWVRGVGDSAPGPSQNDSIMIGLDGALTTLLTGFPQGQGYSWGNTPVGASGPIVVNAPGLHVVNVWMREDGFAFDKLLLSSNPSFNPTGIGPAESALIGPAIAVGHSGGNLVLSWTGPGTLQSATNVSGPYSDVLGAGNPFGIVPTGTQKFYRVRP